MPGLSIGVRMKRLVKWAALAVGAIALLGVVLAGAAGMVAEHKRNRVVQIEVRPVPYVGDAAATERGRYLFASRGCAECHGRDGAGRVFIDDGGGMFARGPNITSGPGGVVARYTEADWVRAIRHGVNPAGRPLLIMPSEEYNRLTDADVAAVVAYVRSLLPATGEAAVFRLPLPFKAAYALGVVRDAAEKIDHRLPPAQPVPEGVTVEHGAYVANMCIGCHGTTLSGGPVPGGPPHWPAASNLTPGEGSVLPRYDSADKLMAMFRSGKRPDGSAVAVMPFEALREVNDTDVAALHAYLKSLPPRRFGGP